MPPNINKSIEEIYNYISARAPKHVHVPLLLSKTKGRKYTLNALMLIFFVRNLGKIMTKKELLSFLKRYKYHEAQPRHIGMQWGFNFLVNGSWHPRAKRKLSAGEYCLMALTKQTIHTRIHRKVCISNKDFLGLKQRYDHRCIICSSKEDELHFKNRSLITKLEKGHCNPLKPLDINTNCVPICQFCNRAYKNKFIINKNGILSTIK